MSSWEECHSGFSAWLWDFFPPASLAQLPRQPSPRTQTEAFCLFSLVLQSGKRGHQGGGWRLEDSGYSGKEWPREGCLRLGEGALQEWEWGWASRGAGKRGEQVLRLHCGEGLGLEQRQGAVHGECWGLSWLEDVD